jgi:RNA recognition motif-containing protein
MKKLFVGNLSWKTTEDDLKKHFEKIGAVVSARIIFDSLTGKSKGFGFVEMEDADAAKRAIEELSDKPLLDRNLRISLALERNERSGGSSGGGKTYNRREGGGNGGGGGREGGQRHPSRSYGG